MAGYDRHFFNGNGTMVNAVTSVSLTIGEVPLCVLNFIKTFLQGVFNIESLRNPQHDY